MQYVFNDRDDLEDVQGFRDKLEACIDMINTYAIKLGCRSDDLNPDKVVINTAVNARDLHCITYKNGKMFYCIDLRQMYGFGGVFICVSDLHGAAELAMTRVREWAQSSSKKGKKQTIKLGGA